MAIYINDLVEHGEYLNYGKSWLVVLSERGNYLLGDKEVHLYNKSQYFVEPDTIVQKITRYSQTISHYENEEGDIMETYFVRDIYNKYEDEDGYNNYPSLEEEFEHRKQLEELKDYKPVYEQKEDEYDNVTLKCVGTAEETGNTFITTAISYGKKGFGSSGFYKIDVTALTTATVKDFVKEFDLHESYHNDSGRDYTRFAKIKGKYIFNGKPFGTEKSAVKYFHTLEDAKQYVETHSLKITRLLKLQVFGNEFGINNKTLSDVVDDLKSFKSRAEALQVKQKSYSDQRILVNKLYDKIEDYTKLIDEVK